MYVFSKDNLFTSAPAFWYGLKTLLKAAGWTVTRSGDGLSAYSAAGDIITTSGGGPGGLSNQRAWFILRQPGPVQGTHREICIQLENVSSLNPSVRFKYSQGTGFAVGTSNATTTPSATDEKLIAGAGTDASPSYGALLPQNYGGVPNIREHIVANNAAPYEWIALGHASGGTGVAHVLMMDGLVPGSYDPLDVDPYLFYWPTNPSEAFGLPFIGTSGAQGWYKFGLSGATWAGFAAVHYRISSTQVIPGAVGVNPYSGKDQIFPILYARGSADAAPGVKGQSSLLRWASNQRNTGDTLSVVGTKDYFIANIGAYPVALPWDGSTPTV